MIDLLGELIIPFGVNIVAALSWDWIQTHFSKKDTPEAHTYRSLERSISQLCDCLELEYCESITMPEFLENLRSCEDIRWHLRNVLERSINWSVSDAQFKDWIKIFEMECRKYALAENLHTRPFTDRDTVWKRIALKKVDPAPGFGDFSKIYDSVILKFSHSWKHDLLDAIDSLEFKEDVTVEYEYIHSDEKLDLILKQCEELAEDAIGEKKYLKVLHEIIRNPHFNKVLMVSGTSGSGKTFFVDQFSKVAMRSEGVRIVCIPMLRDPLSSLQSFFEEQFTSIKDFVCLAETLEIIVCIVYDNVSRLLTIDGDWEKITAEIRDLCRYDVFRFIITVNEYEYYRVTEDDNFLKHYCLDLGRASIFHGINMGELNKEERVVSGILSNIRPVVDPKLTTPLEAIYYKECIHGLEADPPATYSDYIEKIALWKESALQKGGKDILIDVLNDVTRQKETYISTTLDVKPFVDIQLMSTEKRKPDITDISYKFVYYLRIFPYWAVKIISFTRDQLTRDPNELLDYPEEMKEWLICRFLFQGEETRKILSGLHADKLLEYSFFCAYKGTREFTDELYQFVRSVDLKVESRSLCFAILRFIQLADLKIVDKFYMCTLIADAVCEYGLINSYESVFGEILAKEEDAAELFDKMFVLSEVGNSTINHIHGYAVGCRFRELATPFSIDMLVAQLAFKIQDSGTIKKSVAEGKNQNFLDFFLRMNFEKELDVEKRDISDMFQDMKRYFREKKPIGAFVKRNLTCAAGNLFSNKNYYTYQVKYAELVKQFTLSRDVNERQTAWFLISNSVEDNRDPLQPALLELLQELMLDADLMRRHGREMKRLLEDNRRTEEDKELIDIVF